MKAAIMLTLALNIAVSMATGGGQKEDPAKDDLKALQGAWVTVRLVIDGRTLIELKEVPKEGPLSTITYDRHNWVIKFGTKELMTGTSKLDPTKKPKQIDLINETGPDKGKTLLAVYELNGDEYKVCIAAPGKDRPTEFSSKEGSGQRLIIHKRQKK